MRIYFNQKFQKVLPFHIFQGIWFEINQTLFENKPPYSIRVVANKFPIFSSQSLEPSILMNNNKVTTINKDSHWGYLDGASQGSLAKVDIGGILYLSKGNSLLSLRELEKQLIIMHKFPTFYYSLLQLVSSIFLRSISMVFLFLLLIG